MEKFPSERSKVQFSLRLILQNTVVTMEKDTLLNAGMIELRISPLKIILKKIYVRKVEIKDTRIAFVKGQIRCS